jgi:ribosomal protein S18 acetylase RimI-like enzyme
MLTARSVSPFWQPDQDIDWFRRFIQHRTERFSPSFVILARSDGNLTGMSTVITADPALYDLWRWHPVVLPGDHEDDIAIRLIDAAVNQARADGVHRLEVCFDFSRDELRPETEAYYQKYNRWYERCGAVKLDEFVYMTCETAVSRPITPNSLKDDYTISTFNMQDKDNLYDCFYRAFRNGKDRSFLEKTEQERQSMFNGYFDDPENLNQEASLILSKNRQVVGFSIFKSRPHVGDEHLAVLCIHPDHQEKRLGQQLLSISMAKVAQQGDKLMSLGVDLANVAAYKLYKKSGFRTQTKLITHMWKP